MYIVNVYNIHIHNIVIDINRVECRFFFNIADVPLTCRERCCKEDGKNLK